MQESNHKFARWRALLGAIIAQIGISYLEQGVPTLAPYLKKEFLLSSSAVGSFGTSVNLGRAASAIAASLLVNYFGERWMILLACIFSGVMAIIAAQSSSISLILLFLFLSGVAQILAIIAGIIAISNWFQHSNRGIGLGFRQAAVPVGGALAAVSLTPLAFMYSWRIALTVAGFLAIGTAFVGMLIYQENYKIERFKQPKPNLKVAAIDLIRNPNIPRAVGIGVALASSQYIVLTYIQLYLVEDIHVSFRFAGVILAVVQIAGILGRLLWGTISDLYFGGNRCGVLQIAIASAAGGSFGMTLTQPGVALWLIVLMAAVLGFTTVGTPGLYLALISDLAPPETASLNLGIALTFILGSTVLVSPLFGTLVDISASFRIPWMGLSILLLCTLPVAFSIKEPQETLRVSRD